MVSAAPEGKNADSFYDHIGKAIKLNNETVQYNEAI